MKTLYALTLASVFALSGLASAQDLNLKNRPIRLARDCNQVVVCGTKNGVTKEYPNSCAAEDDGATNIKPRPSNGCPSDK